MNETNLTEARKEYSKHLSMFEARIRDDERKRIIQSVQHDMLLFEHRSDFHESELWDYLKEHLENVKKRINLQQKK